MTDIPRRAMARTARLAAIPLGFAGRTAYGMGRRVAGRPAELVMAEVQARTADQIFRVLGELKGGALKLGQAMSVFEAALPEEWAVPYRATLTRLQDAAPPMPTATVHKILAEEFGDDWESLFQEFSATPAASASIGQVHRAIWNDGRPVAVKVQYPGVQQALMSDLTQLSRLVRLSASWVPGLDIAPILAELKARVAEELDYDQEAAAQAQFHQAFADDELFAIPEVITHTSKVIVSEWFEGTSLAAVIADGTPAQRDLAGQRYLEFLLAGPELAGLLHGDPHPGNFRLLPDGRFGILDFGATKRLPQGMPPDIGRLLSVALLGDSQAVMDGLRGAGFIKPSIVIEPDDLLNYLAPFIEPLEEPRFQFSRAWLRELFNHINDPRRPQWSIGLKLNLPPEYVMIHRVWLGGVAVLCQVGGEVPAAAVMTEWLPEFTAPPGAISQD